MTKILKLLKSHKRLAAIAFLSLLYLSVDYVLAFRAVREARVMDYAAFHGMSDVVTHPEIGNTTEYIIDVRPFQAFLKEPSLENMVDLCYGFYLYGGTPYYIDGYVGEYRFQSQSSARTFGWSMSRKFIELMADPETFKQILLDRDIHEEVVSYNLIVHGKGDRRRKMCIWINTEAGDYFLEQKRNLSPEYRSSEDFRDHSAFFTLAEYRKMYGRRLF